MGRIPEETIRQIRERVDIVEVVGRYVALKQAGDNHKGLCPFHNEKTPSFNVNASRQIFHCFGCGEGGNALTFLMKVEGIPFPEAVQRLGEEVGIDIVEDELSPEEEARRRQLEQLRAINEAASEFYLQTLLTAPEAEPARSYLKRRGYDRATAETFRIGFAPDRWEGLVDHLRQRQLPLEPARQLGLIRPGKQGRGDYDLFRGRLMFPIVDRYGQVTAFGGRVLDDSLPKYINSPESAIYQKGRVLYGLHQAKEAIRRTGDVLVVEGYFDVLALHRAGLGHCVATCGTALTGDHAKLLKRYAQRVTLLFDQDDAGQAAGVKAMEGLLPEGIDVYLAEMQAGEDPDSFLQQHGAEALQQRVAQSRPVLEVYCQRQLRLAGSDVSARARAVDEVLGKVRLLPNVIERQLFIQQLSERTGLSPQLLRSKAGGSSPEHASNRRQALTPQASTARSTAKPQAVGRPQGVEERAGELLLQLLAGEPQWRTKIAAEGGEELFVNPDQRAVAGLLLNLAENADPAGLMDEESLNPGQKSLLSGILLKDLAVVIEQKEQIYADCRQSLERERLRRRSREVPGLIAQASAAGDAAQLKELNQELQGIHQRLKNLKR
ncbi:MAG: DNA primase [Desulfuromonas sp.]|nr:MAG: DNA primase [Desulfuromonas sp.]